MRSEFARKLDMDGEVSADGFAPPLACDPDYFTFLPFDVKRLVAVFGMMVDRYRFFYADAIANFHKLSVFSLK